MLGASVVGLEGGVNEHRVAGAGDGYREAPLSASGPPPAHHLSDEAGHHQSEAPADQWAYSEAESGRLS